MPPRRHARPSFHLEQLESRANPTTFTVTNTNDAGLGSLRQAILDADANSGPDVIQFQGVAGTIGLNSTLVINDDLTVQGPGAGTLVVSGLDAVQVFANQNLQYGGGLTTISGLTLTNGLADGGSGGAVFNVGNLALDSVVVQDSTAIVNFYGGGVGGGIYNAAGATLTLTNSVVQRNTARTDGGGLYSVGQLTITTSSILDNTAAGDGGGIYNGAVGGGGGFAAGTETLKVAHSLVAGNSAGYGGGIDAVGLQGGTASTLLVNTTVANNFANYGGGAVAARGTAQVTITNATISTNRSNDPGAGVLADPGAALTVRNSIVAGNNTAGPSDLSGTLAASGNNIFGSSAGGSGYAASDLLNVDPLLSPLADNGGRTRTFALRAGSPALGAADPAVAPASDQRCLPRPAGGPTDIGAFQAQRPTALPETYTTGTARTFAVAAPGVLANDKANDIYGPLTAVNLVLPAAGTGTVVLNADGSFTYTRPTGFSGTVTFTYQASDGVTTSPPTTVTLTVTAAPPVTVAPATLPNGSVNNPYVQAIIATGSPGPFAYAVSAGSLPAGLSLSPTGAITGTPTTAGVANFTVTATDTITGGVGSRAYSVTVTPPPVPPTPPVAARLYVVGAGATTEAQNDGPRVRAFNPDGSVRFDFFAFERSFTGGVRVAVGDVTGDGFDDIVVGAGLGGAPRVVVYDGVTGQQLSSFFAYDDVDAAGNSNRLGVFVAVGDVNGDGKADIVAGIGSGGGPRVRVFDGSDNTILGDFFAYAPDFRGGVRVAVGDVTGDGVADVVASPGPSGGPDVRVFDGRTFAPVSGFTGGGLPADYRGGTFVTVAVVDGRSLIVTAPDSFPNFEGTQLATQFGTLPGPDGQPTGGTISAQAVTSQPTVYVTPGGATGTVGATQTLSVLTAASTTGVRVSAGEFGGTLGVFVGSGPTAGGRLQFYPFAGQALATTPTLDVAAFGDDTFMPSVYVGGSGG